MSSVDMLVLHPFELSGEGKIIVNAKIVDRQIARKVYESLMEIFEPGRKMECKFKDVSVQGDNWKNFLPDKD